MHYFKNEATVFVGLIEYLAYNSNQRMVNRYIHS